MTAIRERLFIERQKRQHPQRDNKILTDWNGLMIAALAQSSRAFGNQEYYHAAETAMRFILEHLQTGEGGLLHRWCDGEAAIPAFADDYAFCIRALIELYETGFDPAWLEESLVLNRYLKEHFADRYGSGFFTTSDKGDILIVRKKEIYDGAITSGNSMILWNLVLLGHLSGDPVYEEQASLLADGFAGIIGRSPSSYSAFLCGLDHLLGPASDIVIAGEVSDPATQEMIRLIHDAYHPYVTLHLRAPSQVFDPLDDLAPFTRSMIARNGKTTAYVCTGEPVQIP